VQQSKIENLKPGKKTKALVVYFSLLSCALLSLMAVKFGYDRIVFDWISRNW